MTVVRAVPPDVGEAARRLVLEEKGRAWLRKVELLPGDEREMARQERVRRRIGTRDRRAPKPRKGRRKTR